MDSRLMSINAINSVSLYEFYYKVNKPSKKEAEVVYEDGKNKKENTKEERNINKEHPQNERPWADVMHQLNLSFNPNPDDDISSIENELDKLLEGIEDKELEEDINELIDNTRAMLNEYKMIQSGQANRLDNELENMSLMNRVNLTKPVL